MKTCELCPRRCRADRIKNFGFCGAGENLRVALVSLHKWEEPCLVGEKGAGTIFFSHCNLRCVYRQNFSVSQDGFGAKGDGFYKSLRTLSEKMSGRQN